jgi:rhodanese-related sulfurtransferase
LSIAWTLLSILVLGSDEDKMPALILHNGLRTAYAVGMGFAFEWSNEKKNQIGVHMIQLSVQTFRTQFLGKQGCLLVDVREPIETALGVIPGATLCPLAHITELDLQDHHQVVVYCKAGGRSMRACQYLEQTYPEIEIYNLQGGYDQFLHEI